MVKCEVFLAKFFQKNICYVINSLYFYADFKRGVV